MRDRPIKVELKKYEQKLRKELEKFLIDTSKKKCDPWTTEELDKVLKNLKCKQILDMKGHLNKLLHLKYIGAIQ